MQGQLLKLAGIVVTTASCVHGAYISDYFNNLGTTQGNLHEMTPSTGAGWSGNWVRGGTGGTIASFTDYVPASQLSTSATGYSAAQNESGSDDGSAGAGANTYLTFRSFAAPLTGTVWASFLYTPGTQTGTNSQVVFAFDPVNTLNLTPADQPNLVLMSRNATPPQSYEYNDVSTSGNLAFASGTTYLAVAKIEVDYSGAFDRVSYWIQAANVTTEAALGTPDFTASGVDAYGDSLTSFGFYGRGTSVRVDNIRLSDEAGAFAFVTTGVVPEPASLSVLALALGATLRRRRS